MNCVLPSSRYFLCLLLVTMGIAGCASMNTVRHADPHAGQSRTFAGNYDAVSAATVASIEGLNVEITESRAYPHGLTILVNKPLSAWSWGEVVRVIVERGTAHETFVWVHSEKRLKTNVTATSVEEFAEAIFGGIESYLLLLR